MISFTTSIKNELVSYDGNRNEDISLLSSFIRYSSSYTLEGIQINTENSKIARKIFTLFKSLYNITPVIANHDNTFKRGRIYVISIKEKVALILKDLSILDESGCYIANPNSYLLDSEEEKRAYLRGLFLACGSINDPKTSRYHLEFFVDITEEANYISSILNFFNLNSKVIKKDKRYMIYIKEAEKIGDFLRIINAFQGVMYYEDIRIYRDHKNMTNRLNNMEQANIDKVIMSCNAQIEDIKIIMSVFTNDDLDQRINDAITYRLKYPESSLEELSQIMSGETGQVITKSGLNHRFRKIREMANIIKNNQ